MWIEKLPVQKNRLRTDCGGLSVNTAGLSFLFITLLIAQVKKRAKRLFIKEQGMNKSS